MRVAILGCGSIAGIYVRNLLERFSDRITITGVCARHPARARAFAAQFGGLPVYSNLSALLSDPTVDTVLNLTPPAAHYETTLRALEAGKHVYSEKPLAAVFSQGATLVERAAQRGLTLWCAPDTVLGAALQSCEAYLRDGLIGTPLGATAFLLKRGIEDWHPDPAFFYRAGGGPLLDMGPYYLTALVRMLGPIESVSGMTHIPLPSRTISSGAHAGTSIPVHVPTWATALLRFRSGVLGTLLMTFDAHRSALPHLEIYGSAGTLTLPDPDTFFGPIYLWQDGHDVRELPLRFPFHTGNVRGLGLYAMEKALCAGTPSAENTNIALHVLEIAEAIERSQAAGQVIPLTTTVLFPA